MGRNEAGDGTSIDATIPMSHLHVQEVYACLERRDNDIKSISARHGEGLSDVNAETETHIKSGTGDRESRNTLTVHHRGV